MPTSRRSLLIAFLTPPPIHTARTRAFAQADLELPLTLDCRDGDDLTLEREAGPFFKLNAPRNRELQADAIGGDTVWASNVAAYNGLSEPIRRLLELLKALHDLTRSVPEWRHNGDPETHARWKAARDKHPAVVHPVLRTHPVSGAKAMIVNEVFTARIVGLSDRESVAILDFLYDHISRPEYTVRWHWKPDDLVLWDNRSTQHNAMNDHSPHRRIMHRATVLGDRPY